MNLDPEVVSLGVRLTEAAARNSVEELIGRIRAAKTRKDAGETIELLEEIIKRCISVPRRFFQAFHDEVVEFTLHFRVQRRGLEKVLNIFYRFGALFQLPDFLL